MRLCPFCGGTNPPEGRFCAHCGGHLPIPPTDSPRGPAYSPFRFQVDPLSPPPRRSFRWISIVLGLSFVVVSLLLFGIAAIVSTAVSEGCGSSPCATPDPGPWFGWVGLPFLAVGALLLLRGLWQTFR